MYQGRRDVRMTLVQPLQQLPSLANRAILTSLQDVLTLDKIATLADKALHYPVETASLTLQQCSETAGSEGRTSRA